MRHLMFERDRVQPVVDAAAGGGGVEVRDQGRDLDPHLGPTDEPMPMSMPMCER
jgi:hypothetical protein